MNTNKKITACIIISILILTVLLSGCLTNHNENLPENLPSFEVHEWGVFCQKYNSNITSFVSKPPPLEVYYDKPVIYFHCNESLSNVSIEVDINGDIFVTIPQANLTDNGIGWNVDIVNNTVIAPDGTEYNYLFYEGQMNISQGVVAYVVLNNETVTFYVKNIANYTISDVFFVYGKPYSYDTGEDYIHFYSGYRTAFCYIESLKSGEEKIVNSKILNTSIFLDKPIIVQPSYNSSNLNNNVSLTENITQLLMKQGLTRNESVEFVDYWLSEWFKTGGYKVAVYEYSSLIYTIPQEIYDSFLPISISPEPDIVKRVGLFYVTDIPIHSAPFGVTITTDKGIYNSNTGMYDYYIQGDIMNITVVNHLEKDIFFKTGFIIPFCTLYFEIYNNGSWELYDDILGVAEYPDGYTFQKWLDGATKLSPNESLTFQYNLVHSSGFNMFQGKYRFRLDYFSTPDEPSVNYSNVDYYTYISEANFVTVYSNEFTIKEQRELLSSNILIYGESFIGVQYTKEINITLNENGYFMTYICENSSDFKRCDCKKVEKNINETTIESYLNYVNTLVDEGEGAKCCDHPWTEMEIIYKDESKNYFILHNAIDIETILGINC